MNFNKTYLLLLLLSKAILPMEHALENCSHEYKNDQHHETKKEHELRLIAQELIANKNCSHDKAIAQHKGLVIITDTKEQTATAIFEIPNTAKQYTLSDAEKERIKESVTVYAAENNGRHKIVKFSFKDPALLPKTKEQAIFLLYTPYTNTNHEQLQENKKDCPLDETQKKLLYAKISFSKQVIERAKQEYEKSKGNSLTQALAKITAKKEGLLGTTIVKTDTGYRKIEELKVGDTVSCYDFKNGKETFSKITFADKVHLSKHIQITLNDQTIHVSPTHKFYIQSWNMWVQASDLKNNLDLRQLVDSNIKDVKEVKEALDVVRITVDGKQNFFITDHNILVHNFAIEATILWGIGEGAVITWAILKPTLISIGVGVCASLVKKAVVQNKASSSEQSPRLVQDYYEHSKSLNPSFLQQDKENLAFNQNNNDTSSQNLPINNNEGTPSPQDPHKDNNRKEVDKKVPEDLIKEAQPGRETAGKTKQFEKPGNYKDALKDFESLKPNNVQDIPTGKRGTLPDGRPVNVQNNSSDKRPTLEIQNPNKNFLKIRYGNK